MLAQRVVKFLHKLVTRNMPTSASFALALDKTAKGECADFNAAVYQTDFAPIYAPILSAFGAECADDAAKLVGEACVACINRADGSEASVAELTAQLGDAIDCLAEDDPTGYNHAALCQSFRGRTFKMLSEGRIQFTGAEAYPVELSDGERTYRLIAASYKKGLYQLVADTSEKQKVQEIDDYEVWRLHA